MEEFEKHCPPPTAEMLRVLEEILQPGKVKLACYFGGAHIELAEVLYRFIPHKYWLMDAVGRHRALFRWDPDDDCFSMLPVQPARPDCLKVPFSDEGAPPHDLLIRDMPFYVGQFEKAVQSRWYASPAVVLCLYGAVNIDRVETYDWQEGDQFLIGRCKVPKMLDEDLLKKYYQYARDVLKYFPKAG